LAPALLYTKQFDDNGTVGYLGYRSSPDKSERFLDSGLLPRRPGVVKEEPDSRQLPANTPVDLTSRTPLMGDPPSPGRVARLFWHPTNPARQAILIGPIGRMGPIDVHRLHLASRRFWYSPTKALVIRASMPSANSPPLIRLSSLFPERAVYAKCEFLAPSGCFKIRGATHLLTHLSAIGGTRRLVVPSMGNTALGAAVGAKTFGFSMIGVVPQAIARAKDEKLQALGVGLVKIAGG